MCYHVQDFFNGLWYCLTVCYDYSLVFIFPTVTTSYWLLSMGVKERNLKRLNRDPLRSRDLYVRWRGH